MSQCIRGYALPDMRILDIFQSRSFSIIETPLRGDEEALLAERYRALLDEWQKIRAEWV